MSKNNDDKVQKSKMLEIRDILKNQVQIYSNLHTTLNDTSKGFDRIDDAYTTYGSEITVSSNHISKLKKREFFENLFIYIGFVFFFLCVTYILLKRFPNLYNKIADGYGQNLLTLYNLTKQTIIFR